VVIAFSPDDMAKYYEVAGELRAAGIAAEVYLGSSGMRPQMKYADRRLSPAAVILGGDEIAAGTVTIKDLDLGRALAAGVTDNAEWREFQARSADRAARGPRPGDTPHSGRLGPCASSPPFLPINSPPSGRPLSKRVRG